MKVPRHRSIELTIDGHKAQVLEGSTLLAACESLGIETPTLCWAENLTPVNACRICVVEVEGAKALVPSCSRKVEPGMVVQTDSPRVRSARRMVLELLGSSVDMSLSPVFAQYSKKYGARPERYGPKARSAPKDSPADGAHAATVALSVKVDNELFVRDYEKCMLCFKCVEACGSDAQHSFAIAVAGRGFQAHISTEHDVSLADSACVFCGNCVGVCPTGALMFKPEYDLRQHGAWDESKQTVTDTICGYCGVGCTLTLLVQQNRIVRVTSPPKSAVTAGHLCIKGRFGWTFVEGDGKIEGA